MPVKLSHDNTIVPLSCYFNLDEMCFSGFGQLSRDSAQDLKKRKKIVK